MSGTKKDVARKTAFPVCMALLMCCVFTGCQTVKPVNSTLREIQEWSTPEPPDRLSPPREQARAKAAMVRWLEQYLKYEYRVTDQRFVLAASVGSKANQYVKQNLGGVPRPDTWLEDDDYSLLLWTLGEGSPRQIGFVMTNEFLPGTGERTLVGYFELVPSGKR
jgi:hypothetical protein